MRPEDVRRNLSVIYACGQLGRTATGPIEEVRYLEQQGLISVLPKDKSDFVSQYEWKRDSTPYIYRDIREGRRKLESRWHRWFSRTSTVESEKEMLRWRERRLREDEDFLRQHRGDYEAAKAELNEHLKVSVQHSGETLHLKLTPKGRQEISHEPIIVNMGTHYVVAGRGDGLAGAALGGTAGLVVAGPAGAVAGAFFGWLLDG